MKINLLVTAIATASVMASSGVMARGDVGSDALKTALGSATLSTEVYGGYTNSDRETDFGSVTKTESSDFDFDRLRFGLQAPVKEDVTFGFEAEWLLDRADLTNSSNDENDLRVNDLYLTRVFGTTDVTLGRYKQLGERANHVEMRDRVFTQGNAFSEAQRRVDGLGVRYYNDLGLHASANVYKGGIDSNTSNGSDNKRNFGYAGSLGWIGSADNLNFGVTLSTYQEDFNENDNGSGNTDSLEHSGYAIEGVLGVGPVVAGLTWANNEQEGKNNGVKNNDREMKHTSIWGAWNIQNAGRNFNKYGVLQGPRLSPKQYGYEVALQYGMGDDEQKFGSAFKDETDFWAIAFNFYCGSFTKWHVEYRSEETEDDASGITTIEEDVFSIGGRLSF